MVGSIFVLFAIQKVYLLSQIYVFNLFGRLDTSFVFNCPFGSDECELLCHR